MTPSPRGSDLRLSLLRAQVADAIAAYAAPLIQADLVRLLARRGYALDPEGPCRAGAFALEVYGAFRRPLDRRALLAAAAVELQMEAAYVFDEAMDGRVDARPAEDLALAIALLTAGTAAAADAATHTPDPPATMLHFCVATSEACAGQFLDAVLERRQKATLDEALQMTCLKSGSLGKFAAGFAARVAGAEGDGIALFERLGVHVFTFAQLVDDLRDACRPRASDLAQHKATLPLVFFGRCAENIDVPAHDSGMIPGEIVKAYESSGAPLYAGIVALTYLRRAHGDLELLAGRGYAVEGLGRFLETVESGAADTLGAVGFGMVA